MIDPQTPISLLAVLSMLAIFGCTGSISGSADPGPTPDSGSTTDNASGNNAAPDTSEGGDVVTQGDPTLDVSPDPEDTSDPQDDPIDPLDTTQTTDAEPPMDAPPGDAPDAIDPVLDVVEDTPDATVVDTGEPDTGDPLPGERLLYEPGCFFTGTTAREHFFDVGELGTEYSWIAIGFEFTLSGWREELFDREILSHNLVGFSRNAPSSIGRYILGLGAQIRPASPGLRRRALFYARHQLTAPDNGDPAHTTYYAARQDFAWEVGATYRVYLEINAVERVQRLRMNRDGVEVLSIDEPIDYMNPSLTSSGWRLGFGGNETDHRDVATVGWTFCDAQVRGERL